MAIAKGRTMNTFAEYLYIWCLWPPISAISEYLGLRDNISSLRGQQVLSQKIGYVISISMVFGNLPACIARQAALPPRAPWWTAPSGSYPHSAMSAFELRWSRGKIPPHSILFSHTSNEIRKYLHDWPGLYCCGSLQHWERKPWNRSYGPGNHARLLLIFNPEGYTPTSTLCKLT